MKKLNGRRKYQMKKMVFCSKKRKPIRDVKNDAIPNIKYTRSYAHTLNNCKRKSFVSLMETKTEKVRAIANSNAATSLYPRQLKLVDLMAILEKWLQAYDVWWGDKTVILIRRIKYLWLEDSSYPQIPLWFRRFTKITKNNSKFVNHVNSYGLNKKLNMDFEGKADCYSATKRQNWSNISFLGWPSAWCPVTPMQTLFYNAVANNGVLVKPQFCQK
jgi:hypothetical protein